MTKRIKMMSISFLSVLTCIILLFVSSFAADKSIKTVEDNKKTDTFLSAIGTGRDGVVGMSKAEVDDWVNQTMRVYEINGKEVNPDDYKTESDLKEMTSPTDEVRLTQIDIIKNTKKNIKSKFVTQATRIGGQQVSITTGATYYYDGWFTRYFSVNNANGNGGSATGFCLQPSKYPPTGSTLTAKQLNNNVAKTLMVLWYATGNDQVAQSLGFENGAAVAKAVFTHNGAGDYGWAHAMIAYAYSGETKGLSTGAINLIRSFLTNTIQGIYNQYSYVINRFDAYVAPNAAQDIGWVTFNGFVGNCKLVKSSLVPDDTDNNDSYSLANAVYTVYKDVNCTQTAGTLTTKADGTSNTLELTPGTYYVKETTAPLGFQLDDTVYNVIVKKFETTTVNVVDTPKTIVLGDFLLHKIAEDVIDNNEDTKYKPLANATFEVKSKLTGEVVMTITSDENGNMTSEDADKKLPLGTYIITETSTPTGYIKSDPIEITLNDENLVVSGVYITNKLTVGQIKIEKIDEDTKEPVKGVVYTITAAEDIVSPDDVVRYKKGDVVQEITTDENGFASSNSLYLGVYNVQETEAPYGYIKDDTIHQIELIYQDEITSVIEKTLFPTNKEAVSIQTTAKDKDTDTNIAVSGEKTTLIDSIKYTDILPDREYTVKGILVDKETGEPILIDDKEITSETIFTPTENEGSIDVTFEFDSSTLKGKDVVVFETLYYKDVEITNHKDLNDTGQTIQFLDTTIKTSAKDKDTSDHITRVNEKTTLIDTIEYKDIVPGYEYVVKGILMNKETGEPVLIEENEVTSETTFTPTEKDGTVDVEFTFNSTTLKGVDTIVFETLYYKDVEITNHKDIEDKDQTIQFLDVEIKTKVNKNTVDSSKDIKVKDTISYKGVVPGYEYTVSGKIMDKSTGKPLTVNDKEIIATGKFTPEKSDGETTVEFTVDTSSVVGKTFVVFEKLYYGETEIANHEDINDQNQSFTVNTPNVPTQTGDTNLPLIIVFGSVFIFGLLYIVKRFKK